jgi:hypothetical protein
MASAAFLEALVEAELLRDLDRKGFVQTRARLPRRAP